LALRRERAAARHGRDLLENKREALLRALADWTARRDRQEALVAARLGAAREAAAAARIEIGRDALMAAALAQPATVAIDRRDASIVGVRVPRLAARVAPLRLQYGPAATSEAVDAAAARYHEVVGDLVLLAEQREAVRALKVGLLRTARRLNALEKVVLPGIEREIAAVTAAIEEDERDEALRRASWIARRRGAEG
jgi:V/A-type H+-transporting ATPase subunit D